MGWTGKTRQLIAAIIVAGAGVTAMRADAAALGAAQTQAIDAAGNDALAKQSAPGISVAVMRDGAIVYARGFGLRDTAKHLPVEPSTYFEIGSVTKQFTSTAIAMLVHDGKFAFDDKLATMLPDAPHAGEITIRQLLNMSSGLPDYLGQPGVAPYLTSTTVKPAALVALVAGQPLHFTPGTSFEYSNTNYALLGAIVERSSGMTYGDFLRARVLRPPFDGISYGPPAGQTIAGGYATKTATEALTIWTSNVSYAAGALYATPSQLGLWDDAFFNGRVVDAATVAALTTPPTLAGGGVTDYAAGWVAEKLDGHVMIWHNGGLPGFNARNVYFPEQHLAIVVCANVAGFDESPLVRAIFRTFVPPSAAALAAESAPAPGEDPAITARAREQYRQWSSGNVDLTAYDPAVRATFNSALVAQVAQQLGPLGAPTAVAFVMKAPSTPGSTGYVYRIVTPRLTIQMTLSINAAGLIDGIYFKPA